MQTSEFDTFGKRLEFALGERGLAQRRISRMAGISDPMIRKYIRGETSPNLTKVEDLAKALNISFLWLAKGRGPMDNIIYDDIRVLDDIVLKKLSVNLFELKNIINLTLHQSKSVSLDQDESDEVTQKILKECIRMTLAAE